MSTLDTLLPIVGLIATVAIPAVAIVASYRRARPYKVICRNFETGMVAVRWRDEPHRTRWVSPATLQKGLHR